MEWDMDRKQDSMDAKNTKRKMKTPTQLEILERVYAEDKYPSETVRAELSAQLQLTDKQLQVWFGHKRLKDRKVKEEELLPASRNLKKEIFPVLKEHPAALHPSKVNSANQIAGIHYNRLDHDVKPHEQDAMVRNQKGKDGRDVSALPRKRSQQLVSRFDPQVVAELSAIAAVERQLGEPLREDGPVLGVEFDPLPPGAFDTSIEHVKHAEPVRPRKFVAAVDGLHHDVKVRERPDAKSLKSANLAHINFQTSGVKRKGMLASHMTAAQRGPLVPQEYQFIPEQPSTTHFHERNLLSSFERTVEMIPRPKIASLPSPGSIIQGSEPFPTGTGYRFESRASMGGFNFFPPRNSRTGSFYASNDLGHEHMKPREALTAFSIEGQFGAVPVGAAEIPLLGSEKLALFHEQEHAKMEKKRKIEEARLAKEIEAQEKRIRKEIEKQDALRRKHEERMRKEFEKQDRERKKEEERLTREKVREEERAQRELRREYERREKILRKELQRAENERRKEEVRKEKEAARMRAAFERATAKKLSKDSKGAVDDEELELMQAHALVAQGVSSISSIDGANLLSVIEKRFPPSSVTMKKPFSISPWIDSEENVSKFFMIWRFLATFADVIGLWPFTVDELAQALHDYDSRLLSEVHIALFKTFVKDVEMAAQAASNGAGGSNHATAFAAGGHPRIVEAACAWGFDIQDWGQLAHPLTWPEIIRQFSLAAGFGPRWKSRKIEIINPKDSVRVIGGEHAVSTLRSGAAAANAVAFLQGKHAGHLRRARCRLTPGTVKYAAFHVLCFEGDKGLSISEVADRIQKYGLRDLTRSKTPEASVSAALSRDTDFFVRVAPSTYSVRPAFRKDPSYAEEILHAAREKISLYQTDFSDVEEVNKGAAEIDVDDLSEVDEQDFGDTVEHNTDGGFPLSEADHGGRNFPKSISLELKHCFSHCNSLNQAKCLDAVGGGNYKLSEGVEEGNCVEEETEVDESQVGEPWVQGLMEGDYANLSVEERLNALVVLIDVINEGNTIRAALEERYELASALKRQLWEEVQLDKRRSKEELITKSQHAGDAGAKSERGSVDAACDERHSSMDTIDGLCMPVQPEDKGCENSKEIGEGSEAAVQFLTTTDLTANNLDAQNVVAAHEKLTPNVESALFERSRAEIKAEIRLRAEKLYVFRSLPLGYDRRRNRYWHFVTCNGVHDPGSARIYFESQEDGHWGVIDSEEALNSLMSSLDTRGIREFHLHTVLKRLEGTLKQAMRTFASTTQPTTKTAVSGSTVLSKDVVVQASGSELDEVLINSQLMKVTKKEGSPHSGIFVPGSDRIDLPGAIQVELCLTAGEKKRALDRHRSMERWLWVQCFRANSLRASSVEVKREVELLRSCDTCHELYLQSERHCPQCHITIDLYKREKKFLQHVRECEERRKRKDSGFRVHGSTKVLPPRMQVLMKILLTIEAAIPCEALKSYWAEVRKSWCEKLRKACTPAVLLELFLELESAVQQEWLSSYETAEEIFKSLSSGDQTNSGTTERALFLPWIPHTTAAVALRIMAFDAALAYSAEQKQQHETLMKESINNGNDSLTGPVASSVPISEEDAESNQFIAEDDKESPSENHFSVRGRGRGHGRCHVTGRGGSNKESGVRQGASRKSLQYNQAEGQLSNSEQVAKSGPRPASGHLRGRPGRSRSQRTQMKGHNIFGTDSEERKKKSTLESSSKWQTLPGHADGATTNSEQEASEDWDVKEPAGDTEPSEDEPRGYDRPNHYQDDSDEPESDDEDEDEEEEEHDEDDAREIDIEVSDELEAEEEEDDEGSEEEERVDEEMEGAEIDEDSSS